MILVVRSSQACHLLTRGMYSSSWPLFFGLNFEYHSLQCIARKSRYCCLRAVSPTQCRGWKGYPLFDTSKTSGKQVQRREYIQVRQGSECHLFFVVTILVQRVLYLASILVLPSTITAERRVLLGLVHGRVWGFLLQSYTQGGNEVET